MLTKSDIESLNLGISPVDDRAGMIINAGIEWLEENTTISPADIPANNRAKLFLLKFYDLQNMQTGITSESIEGLSQSYDTSNKNDLLWQFADELLGQYLKGRVRFVPSVKRW